ncbi:bifunctional serine/threonine-protein kinase/formylglycine-generating enzyme family protein [Myxococcota bacterium]|nr:bifunctional serine/threonine-protein kinase/formylglycine-generating enzyme family protein [Myxococcota bacterium]
MGRVIEAWDPDLARHVALKVPLASPDESGERLARFVAEARLTARLDHPGICPVHEMGVSPDGRVYFVMKRIGGRTLRGILAAVASGDPRAREEFGRHRLLTLFVQVCQAVAFAHDRGVVHRDLKPENVMIGPYGEVFVMDWGVARASGVEPSAPGAAPATSPWAGGAGLTAAGATLGTPGYMSPEQAWSRAEEVGAPSDVWSLGALLFEILACRRAFEADDPYVLMFRAAREPPPDPRAHAPGAGVEDEIAEICLRAMAPAPAERFPHAGALARSVSAYLDGTRRSEQAHASVVEGKAGLVRAETLRRQGEARAREAEEALRAIPEWRPEGEKRAARAKLRVSEDARIEADALETEAVERFHAALRLVPEHGEARETLADLYARRLEEAEARRDRAASRGFEMLLRAWGGPRHGPLLAGDGAVTLLTDPPGASVEAYRYVDDDGRLVLQPYGDLGITPLDHVPLPMGSWLLVLRAEGRPPVRYPVHLPRGHHWDGVPPGGGGPLPVLLPGPGQLGPDDVYVPAGWFAAGGDPMAARCGPRARVWLDAFVLRRYPVTNEGYIAWLDSLVGEGREDEAARRCPREQGGTMGRSGSPIYGRDPQGRFLLRPDSEGDVWRPDWPVVRVGWADAVEFARGEACRSGQPWRLPGEWEREKAARGVDGRWFPWGDGVDASRCCCRDSHAGRPLLAPVSSFPVDESPYGVRGCAGNSRDWCADAWVTADPLRDGEAATIRWTGDDAWREAGSYRAFRGGGWSSASRLSRAAHRFASVPDNRMATVGIRLARSFP